MNGPITSDHNKPWFKTYVWLLIVFWTLVISASLTWNLLNQNQSMREIAFSEAHAYLNKDKAFRFWATSHGGLYVPSNERTPPNPYLTNVTDRDIETPSGIKLTLMNPSYAVRQMNENFTQLYGVAGHITSLKLLRPQNAPDDWERGALMAFNDGKKEVTEFTEVGGETHLRLMGPLVAEKRCLKCHANQGYQEGDILGGVGVSVPMTRLLTLKQQQAAVAVGGHVGLWLLGLLGIGLGTRQVSRRMRVEQQAALLESEKRRMEDELNIGREIQMSMVPKTFPAFPDRREFSIYATLQPAREVGGDFYDFFFIDENRLCLCIGDVSGKGVPAALFMAVTKTLIKSRATDDFSTASIITHVNDELSRDNKAYMFVTIFMGILDIKTGALVYTNAGHNPPYLIREDDSIERLDQKHGPVVGAMGGRAYKEDKTNLTRGDMLLLYTDGITEAMDPAKNLFSEKRLAELLSSQKHKSAEEVVQSTVTEVKRFEDGMAQADDITALAAQYFGILQETEDPVLEMVVQNRLPEIERFKKSFNTFSEQYDIPTPVRRKMNVVFDELLNNIITYAYRDEDEHSIEIKVELSGDRLTVSITDDGIPFNPFGVETPDTKLSLEERKTGGLGIHLVRKVMDKVSYQRRIDKNVITLVKDMATATQ